MSESSGRSLLERTLARLGRGRAKAGRDSPAASLSAAAFRAAVNERLRSLERQLDELRGRVNGLIFLLAGAVAAQLVLRLLE
ncbi:MAG: hypothetical protein U1B78_06925 [Dehalococcoidia bacterium]|nr:hypothetical protein [Dehalococcoidia bacterium]